MISLAGIVAAFFVKRHKEGSVDEDGLLAAGEGGAIEGIPVH